MSYHKFNESQREQVVLRRLKQGDVVALISDAGMPGISDPGMELVSVFLLANLLLSTRFPNFAVANTVSLNFLIMWRIPTSAFTIAVPTTIFNHVDNNNFAKAIVVEDLFLEP